MFIAESLKWSAFRDLNVLKLSWKWTWFEGACLHWLGWTVYNKTKHVDNWHVCSGENQVNPDPFTQMLLQMIPSLKKKKRTVKAVFNVTLCELNSWLLTIINQTPDQDLMTQWDYVVYRVLWKQITWTLAWVQSAEHWHPNHAHQSWLHMARQTLQTNRVRQPLTDGSLFWVMDALEIITSTWSSFYECLHRRVVFWGQVTSTPPFGSAVDCLP